MEAPQRPIILMADDDPINLRILARHLESMGDLVPCRNGAEALERALVVMPDLILLDVTMPVMDGYEACRKLKSMPQTQPIPVIFITGLDDEKSETAAFALGAVDFVAKPFKPAVVQARVGTHLELKRFRDGLEAQVQQRTQELQDTQREILRRLAMAAEYRDPDTGAHINRIRSFTELLCTARGLDEGTCAEIAAASVLHDVGKIGVPDGILLKPARLTPEEFEIMKRHTTIGGQLLEHLTPSLFRTARDIALGHHEWWNGAGYPAGLSGEAIPLSGRIVALCDVFDALTSERPYKRSWAPEEAFREIIRGRGSHFDPALTELFLSLEEDLLHLRSRYQDPAPQDEPRL